MEIPFTLLAPDTLRALIEEFVLREGTEYGERDVALADKVDAVLLQLKRGEARVLYDADSETTTIAPAGRATADAVPHRRAPVPRR
jgi:uncharacterized protein YheU (UPF0270 family)